MFKFKNFNSENKTLYFAINSTIFLVCSMCMVYVYSAIKEIYLYKNNFSNIASINESIFRENSLFSKNGKPIKIKIPKINVNANIESAGLDANFAMIPPKSPDDVTWFNLGPRPGEIGSSVLAGHFGWKGGRSAAFDNLHKLVAGDKIYIIDDYGSTTTFQVSFSRRYDPKSNSNDVFISEDNRSHLNLVTCEGVWNKVLKSYSKRLVVFSNKI